MARRRLPPTGPLSLRALFRSPVSSLAYAGLVAMGIATLTRASNRAKERASPPAECQGLSSQECRAGVEWMEKDGEVQVHVLGLVLATHQPVDSQPQLNPEQVELVAAHEMGHALGLPHSDNPRDVMFPQSTATRLTNRDFRTVEALYSLPYGAEIRR